MTFGEVVFGEAPFGEPGGPGWPVGTLTVTLPKLTAGLSGTYQGAIPGTLGATLPFPTVGLTGTYTPPLRTGALDVVLPKLAAELTGTWHPTTEPGALDVVLPKLAAELTGTYTGATPTDTTNTFNGRTRTGHATVTRTHPTAPPPPGTTYGTRVDKALALRDPVMVGGRPT